jgi:deazaflavin-dependent oxidoreductase (nitroreductase family)
MGQIRPSSRRLLRISKIPPRILYALGLGPLMGRIILLLTAKGRVTGLKRVTPLQYEELDGRYYIGSMRGAQADWFRNIVADPNVHVRVGRKAFRGVAEAVTDPHRIADFLSLRLERHPRMVGAIMRSAGVPSNPSRDDLESYASKIAMVVIQPEDRN